VSTNHLLRQLRRLDPHFIRYPERITFPESLGEKSWTFVGTADRSRDDEEYVRWTMGEASSESDDVTICVWEGGDGVMDSGGRDGVCRVGVGIGIGLVAEVCVEVAIRACLASSIACTHACISPAVLACR
jgi:hypothetical protein